MVLMNIHLEMEMETMVLIIFVVMVMVVEEYNEVFYLLLERNDQDLNIHQNHEQLNRLVVVLMEIFQ